MHIRSVSVAATLAVLAGAAQAQPDEFIFTWEVNAFDVATGAIVATNVSQLQSGQGAEFIASWSFTPPVGTVRTNHNNQTGTIAAFSHVFADFNASAGHRGDFSPALAGSLAWLLFNPGTVEPDRLRHIQHAQLVPGPAPYAENSLHDAFRIRWTPSDWHLRTVDFSLVKSVDAQFAAGLHMVIPGPPTVYAGYRIQNEDFHGGSVQLSIIPAPSGLALLSLGALITTRRRR